MTTAYACTTCSTTPARRSRPDLDSDRQFGLAMTRLLEILGEAAARVSDTGRQRWPAIPWAKIVGLRNRLIHGYDKVDFDILWIANPTSSNGRTPLRRSTRP